MGGGPAGTSAALGLLRSGFEVTLAEKRRTWSGRVCGSFLSPEACSHLEDLGLLSRALDLGALPLTRVFVHGPEGFLSEIDLGPQKGLAWPRRDLEKMLLCALEERGGRVLLGQDLATPDALPLGTGRLLRGDSTLKVNASGRFASGPPRKLTGWYGWNASFEGIPQEPGELSLHFFAGGYVGIITFQGGLSNVCGLSYRLAGRKEAVEDSALRAMEAQPSFKNLVQEGRRQNSWQMVGPLPYSASMRASEGALLAGDAAAVGDPFWGEGIGRALGAGPLLHSCLRSLGQDSWDIQKLKALYRSRWEVRYRPRLRLGFAARACLRSEFLISLALRWTLGGRGKTGGWLPLIHGAKAPGRLS